MEIITKLQFWTQSIVSTSAGVISGYWINKLSLDLDNKLLMLSAVIIILTLLSKTIEYFLKYMILNFIGLRKLIFRNHFIEGYWLEIVNEVESPTQVYLVSILKISFVNMTYVVNGETFSDDGKIRGMFHSNYSKYEANTLKYAYEGLSMKNNLRILGNAEFKFTQSNNSPIRFLGTLSDNSLENSVRIIADKILGQDLIDIDQKTNRSGIVKKYLADLKEND